MDKEVQELQKRFEESKNQMMAPASNMLKLVEQEIDRQYAENNQELAQNSELKEITEEVVKRKAKAVLSRDMLAVLSEEQKNELAKFILDCEKEKLNFRKRKEKKVIIENVKADIFNQKVEALKKKYGYLYKKDENGEIVGFVPNKLYNKYAAFVNWWDNTTNDFKKIVKGTLKVVFWAGVVAVVVLVGYHIFDWVSSVGNNLPK